MTTARDVMTTDVEVIDGETSVAEAAGLMARLDIGALPVCGEDRRLVGVLTDRDIVVEVVAAGRSPEGVTVASLVGGEAVTVGADDDLAEARRTMAEHQVKRLPVIDGQQLVGIVTLADVAEASSDDETGSTVQGITE